MATRDLKAKIKIENIINEIEIITDTTIDGNWIDMLGYESCAVDYFTNAVTTGNVTIQLWEADLEDKSDASIVESSNITGIITLISTPNTDNLIGYFGKKRYIKVKLISSGTASLRAGVKIIKGNSNNIK